MKSYWQPVILEALKNLGESTSLDIYDQIGGINRSTLYYSLRRLENLGRLEVDRSARFNLYTYIEKFKRFSYSIRVVETSKAKVSNRWGEKGESVTATVTGICPIDSTENQIKKAHRQRLFDKMLEILSEKDPPVLAIPARLIHIDDMHDRGVSGVEFTDIDESTFDYDEDNQIEVEFINSQGQMYDRSDGFDGTYQTRIDDY